MAKWMVSINLLQQPGSGQPNLNVGEQVEADNVLDALDAGYAAIKRTMAATGLVKPVEATKKEGN